MPDGWGGIRFPIPFDFGWAALTFTHDASTRESQAWVGLEHSAAGRFRVSESATPHDSGCGPPLGLPRPFF